MLKSKRVPQADILDDVINTASYVQRHPYCSDYQIAAYIGKVDRQGRYYRHAAALLGFVVNRNNSARITDEGIEFLGLSKQAQNNYLRNRLDKIEVFKLSIEHIRDNPGCTIYDIQKLLTNEGIVKLAKRRSRTIVSWLVDLNIVRQAGESLRIN